MPRIQLQYQDKSYTLELAPNQISKAEIEKLSFEKWGLKFQDFHLTYLDMDGDEITADIEEDFEVAKMTMIGEKDNLVFTMNLNAGAVPLIKFEIIKEQSAPEVANTLMILVQSQGVREINVDDLIEQTAAERAPSIENQQEKPLKFQNVPQLEEPLIIDQKKDENGILKVEEKVLAEAQMEAHAEEKQIKELIEKIKQENQIEWENKKIGENLKEEPTSIPAKDGIPIKKEKPVKTKSPKQAKQGKQVKEIKQVKQVKQSKDAKKVKEVKEVKQGKVKPQPAITEARVRQLVRLEIQKMIPELRTKILDKQSEQKASVPQLPNTCNICQSKLRIPFYYNPEDQTNVCDTCEPKIITDCPLMKIKNLNHFENVAFIYGGIVSKKQLTHVELDSQKYIEQGRNLILAKIKEQYKVKILEYRKIKAEQKKKQKSEKLEKEKLQKIKKQNSIQVPPNVGK